MGEAERMDDWKGEGLIRNSVTRTERASETKSIVNRIYHAERRKQGIPAAAAKGHATFVKLAVFKGTKK